MDSTAQIKALAARIPSMIGNIQTEEATKQVLILPFINALGYNVFDLEEVVPEFDANVGAAKKFKLDYAIFKEGKPIILIECKCINDKLDKDDAYTQLFAYYAAVEARIGVLTNGIIYRFYADLDKQHVMDKKPFLEIDMSNLKEPVLEELKRITKSSFDIEEMISAATEMKYIGGILSILTEQMNTPSEDFTKVFYNRLCPEKSFIASVKPLFADYTQRALKQFVRDQVNISLGASGFTSDMPSAAPVPNPLSINDSDTADDTATTEGPILVFTEEERQGYYIIKAILRQIIDPARIAYRDVQSYCGILLDDNKFKPICRLYFNNPKSLKLGLFDHGSGEKQEQKVPLNSLDDIYQYAEQLKATINHYEVAKMKDKEVVGV